MYRLFGFLVLISSCYGQLALEGKCDFTAIDYLKIVKIEETLGSWYQVGRIDNNIEKGNCSTITFTGVRNANNVITNVYILVQEVVNGQVSTRNGEVLTDGNKFTVIFNDNTTFGFVILGTNYKDYAVLYSCHDQTNGRSVMAWKLSRTKEVSSTSTTNIDAIIKKNPDLANATWIQPSHDESTCKILNNSSVIFRISPILLLLFGFLASKLM